MEGLVSEIPINSGAQYAHARPAFQHAPHQQTGPIYFKHKNNFSRLLHLVMGSRTVDVRGGACLQPDR